MAVQPVRYAFTVDDYYRMAEAGILGPDDRVELIDGEVVEMSPIGSRHGSCVDRLTRLLVRAAGDRAVVRVQGAVRLDRRSEPEPDLALLRPRDDFYASQQPGPGDVLLLIEVSDTTLTWDLGTKAGLYSRSGVAEYWVVDVEGRQIFVHRRPGPTGYGEVRAVAAGGALDVPGVPGVQLPVVDALGAGAGGSGAAPPG
ncbi:MAG: Uma2 family endonuclease [Acidimicrobiales bacterium]